MSQNTPKKPQGLARLNRLIDLNTYPIQPVLRILLKDHSTGENIIWATDNYSHLGNTYHSAATMRLKDLVKLDKSVIQPRVYKTLELQKQRTKVNAEVFTPSWICCLMNNHLDDIWFGRKDVFNKMKDKSWRATNRPIEFPASGSKTWQGYVDSRRIEITCGEAPYLVSRYDTTTGKVLNITHRIGILDRKLRVVNENAKDEAEWIKWALRAYQATYGYEYQGDSLLIARINLLMTFCDYMQARWDRNPTEDELKAVAFVISWNIWQMNGLTYKTSYDADADKKRLQEIIDECDAEISTYTMCANLPDENYSPTQCDLQLSKEYTLQELIDFVKEEDEISLAYMYAEVHGLKIVEEDKRDFDAEIKQARMQLEEAINEIRLIRDETYAEKCMIIDATYCLIRNWRMRRTEYFRDIAQKSKGKGTMKFDFCIGNPPYQGDNHKQLYPDFYLAAKEIADAVDMIFPIGWQLPKNALNLQKMNTQEIKEDKQIVSIDNRQNVFVGVQGAEWTNILLWRRGYDNKLNGKQLVYINGQNPESKQIPWNKNDLNNIPDELKKIVSHFTKDENANFSSIVYSGRSVLKFTDDFLKDFPDSIKIRLETIQKKQPNTTQLSPNEEYELKTATFEVLDMAFLREDPNDDEKYFKLYGSYNGQRTERWILKKYMKPRYEKQNNIDDYKVLLAEAASAGDFGAKLSSTIIARPNESCTPTFCGIGNFITLIEAENCSKYIKTKLFRALLGVLKTTRHNPSSVFAYIPLQDFTSSSDIDWSKSIPEIDQQLYKKYGLSQEEIDFIESKVKEMT